MTATRSFTFSCDSAYGCAKFATVAGDDVDLARGVLEQALNWKGHMLADLCPDHSGHWPLVIARGANT